MRARSEFTSDADYQHHLEHEVNAAAGRGDKKAEDEARRALEKLHGHAGAQKRPRAKKADVETRA